MIPEDKLYLSNIYEAALKVESYTQSGQAAFMNTPMIQDAVIRNFEIIRFRSKHHQARANADGDGLSTASNVEFRQNGADVKFNCVF